MHENNEEENNGESNILIQNEVPDLFNDEQKKKRKKKIIIIIVIVSIIVFAISLSLILYFVLRHSPSQTPTPTPTPIPEPTPTPTPTPIPEPTSAPTPEPTPSSIPIDEKYYYDANEQIMNYTINKDIIKLGIISDFQLDNSHKNYERNLKKTLEKMKNENVDVILIAGDIVDNGYQSEYDLYKNILNSIYTDINPKRYIFEIMGNHEY